MKPLLTTLILWLVPCFSQAEPLPPRPIDLPLLRDVICSYETQHLPEGSRKDQAVSHRNAVGRCQIQPATAERAGCNWWWLDNPTYNRNCALKILTDLCHGGVWSRAYCYNPSRAYAKTITGYYAAALREQDWRGRTPSPQGN